jgi:hypothetical protein
VPRSRSPAKAFECEEDHHQRQHDLEDEGHGQFTETLGQGRVFSRPVQHFVLLVRLQPDGHARIGFDAGVEERRRQTRLERVESIVRRRVWVLWLLRVPAGLFGGLRGALLRDEFALIVGAGEEGDGEKRQHDRSGPTETAVAEHFDEFLAGNGGNHGDQACMVSR